jgi:hypothetical protein
MQWRDMLRGSNLELEPLWSLLKEQPGFDAELAKPPVARLKLLEPRINLTIVVPSEMAAMTEIELIALAQSCDVSAAEIDKIGRENDPVLKAQTEQARRDAAAAAEEAKERESKRARAPSSLVLIAAVVVVAGLGFAGWQIYQGLTGPKPKFDAFKMESPGLPVGAAKRRGAEALITLSDDSWIRKPKPEREQVLEEALTKAASEGIEVLIVTAKDGRVVGTAQFGKVDGQRKVRVRFQ